MAWWLSTFHGLTPLLAAVCYCVLDLVISVLALDSQQLMNKAISALVVVFLLLLFAFQILFVFTHCTCFAFFLVIDKINTHPYCNCAIYYDGCLHFNWCRTSETLILFLLCYNCAAVGSSNEILFYLFLKKMLDFESIISLSW